MTKEQLVLLTVVELKAIAKENGLKGYSKLRKADLIELFHNEDKGEGNTPEKKETVTHLLKNKTVYTSATRTSSKNDESIVKLYIKCDWINLEDITKKVQNIMGLPFDSEGSGILVKEKSDKAGLYLVHKLSTLLFNEGEKLKHKKLLYLTK